MIRSKNQDHSAVDWDVRRNLITKLYKQPDIRLQDLVSTMAREHNFIATPMMYKRRLHKWGVFKNVLEGERQQYERLALDIHSAGGTELLATDGQGKVIPWDLVKRHHQKHNLYPEMWNNVCIPTQETPSKARSRKTRSVSGSSGLLPLLKLAPKQSPLSYRPISTTRVVEQILYDISAFQLWRSESFLLAEQKTHPTHSCCGDDCGHLPTRRAIVTARENAAIQMVNDCIDGTHHVLLGSEERGHQILAAAVRHFASHLKQPSFFLLYAVLALWLNDHQTGDLHRRSRKRLFFQFYLESLRVLGAHNALTRVLDKLVSGEEISNLWSIAFLSCIDNTAAPFSSGPTKLTTIHARHGLALALCTQGYNWSAMAIYQSMIRIQPSTVWINCRLGSLYRIERRFKEAEGVFLELIGLVEAAKQYSSRNEEEVAIEGLLYAWSLLGQTYSESAQYWQAKRAYEQAFLQSYSYFGPGYPLTVSYGLLYRKFLTEHSLTSELGTFETTYPDIVHAAVTRADIDPSLKFGKLSLYCEDAD